MIRDYCALLVNYYNIYILPELEYSLGNPMSLSEELHLIHKRSEPHQPADNCPLPKRSNGKNRTTDPSDTLEILVEPEGLAADEPTTMGKVFKATVKRIPDHPALRYKEDGIWKEITYKQYYNLVVQAGKGFLKVKLMYMYMYVCIILCS